MRQALRRYGSGALLCAAGAILLIAGTGVGLGYQALADARVENPAPPPASASRRGGVELTATVDVDAPLVPLDPVSVHLQPPLVSDAALPGFSVDRDLGVTKAGLGVDASVDLAAGSHRVASPRGSSEVSASSTRTATVDAAGAPVAVAAAAFTLAGLLAYFWGSLKSLAAKGVVLPLVGLYAKISRAEVFDNGVRERIFQAIRANPGLSASDLARVADVSWGTTIYHLDVLEQTRMVTSIRKGRYRRYFENGANLAASKDAVAVLQNRVTQNVVEVLRARPGVTQSELAAATSMSPQALHWHLARLVETGLVRKEREGRVVRHFPSAN